MKNIFKNNWFLTFVISILIFLTIFIFEDIFYSINDNIKSFTIKSKNSLDSSIDKNLIFVEIDEKTLDSLGFPMSRKEYVPLIENLVKAKAEIIGFDIIFANENKLDTQGDKMFAEAIKKAGNIVFGGAITNQNILEKPLKIFNDGIMGFGYYTPNVDNRTNRVFSFFPEYKLKDSYGETKIYNHFAIVLLKAYFSKLSQKDYLAFNEKDKDGFYIKPDLKVPFSSSGKNDILINFIQKPSEKENKISKFSSYSFIDVYNGNFDPKVFEGKIVVIGTTSQGIKDIFTTTNGIEFGVFVHGNILNTILTENYLQDFPEILEWFFIFLLLLLSVYFNLSRSGYILISSNFSIVIIFLLIYPVFILFTTNYILGHLLELFLALPLSLISANIIKYLFENKNKNILGKALGEYVSKDISKEILTNAGNIKLDGEKKEISIFFSDIEGFTSISEKFSPEDLVFFLRKYLGAMSDIILNNNGFINKYEGDAIMALWGTFKEIDNASELACDTALKQQKALKELNKQWMKEGFAEIKVRIGLHFGEAIIGNIGVVGKKLEYTALGDNVNLASRLEGVNKFYGTYLCVSEIIYKETKEKFVFRYLDEIKVKGKEKSIKIYELIEYKENLTENISFLIEEFEKAIELYKNKNFFEAKTIFLNLKNLGDNPSKTYIERCNYYIKNSPSENWDGIWTFTSKG